MAPNYSIIVPQILECFVYQQVISLNNPNNPWLLNSKGLQNFFQERSRDVMMLLSKLDNNQFTGKRKLMAMAAREQATKWLSDNNN
jgi:hypothetical protein